MAVKSRVRKQSTYAKIVEPKTLQADKDMYPPWQSCVSLASESDRRQCFCFTSFGAQYCFPRGAFTCYPDFPFFAAFSRFLVDNYSQQEESVYSKNKTENDVYKWCKFPQKRWPTLSYTLWMLLKVWRMFKYSCSIFMKINRFCALWKFFFFAFSLVQDNSCI